MTFSEALVQTRKSRGMSQEELAGRVQVSRQAVSKWENGDAMPDLPKLLALADALDISLDALCGRETAAQAAEPGIQPKARRWLWPALCGVLLLIVCLLAGGAWAWSQRNIVPSEDAVAENPLPEVITVSGISFSGRSDALIYQFVPSVAGEQYTYQITFTDADGVSQTFDAAWVGGVCSGSAAISPYTSYLVTVCISNDASSRSIAVAQNLNFSAVSSSWTPLE